MKKKELGAIACLLCFCCCGGTEKEIVVPDPQASLIPLQFTVDLTKEVLPFPSTRSIPETTIPEPTPKNPDGGENPSTPDVDPENLYSRIDYIVYQAGSPDILVKHKRFTTTDPDFTIVYDSLPAGSYRICFLAHSDENISITGQTALFSDVSDTFHLLHPQEVQAGEQIIKNVTLQRIISKIEFMAAEPVPDKLKSFTINVSNYQNKIDLVTGNGISQDTPYTKTYAFKDTDYGKEQFSHAFFTFVPTAEKRLSANLKAIDQIGDIRREREVPDIQPIRNRIIRYTGLLYTPKEAESTFTLEVLNEGQWEGADDNELKEEEAGNAS